MKISSDKIQRYLFKNIPHTWDGSKCILELKEADYQWKQMEWIGFYFEWKARTILSEKFGGGMGPTYANVEFDYEFEGVWDFKSHPWQSNDWIYLNDVQAVNECLMKEGRLAWVIAVGDAQYDETGEFKSWHDQLKGKTSSYERNRIKRGAPSRKRKVKFKLEDIIVVEFNSMKKIKDALDQGWMKDNMQSGQRNSNGTPRNAKYGLNIKEYVNNLESIKI